MAEEEKWLVDDALALLLRVSRFFGTAPVRFESRFGRVVRISRLYYCFNILLSLGTSIYIVKIVKKNISMMDDVDSEGQALTRVQYIYIKFNIISIITLMYSAIHSYLFSILRLKRLLHIYSCITKVKKDICVRKIKSSIGFRKWHVAFLLFVYLSVSSISLLLEGLVDLDDIGNVFFVLLCISTRLTTMLQFVVSAYYTNTAFTDIKNILEAVLDDLNDSCDSNNLSSAFMENMERDVFVPIEDINITIDMLGYMDGAHPNIRNIHRAKLASVMNNVCKAYHKCTNAVEDISNNESVHFCFYLFEFTLNLTWTLYTVIVLVQTEENIQTVVVISLCILYHVFKFLPVVEVTHHIKQLISDIRLLMGQIMNVACDESDMLANAVIAYSNHLILNDVSYSILGICVFDRCIIYSVLGSTTTLLILIFHIAE